MPRIGLISTDKEYLATDPDLELDLINEGLIASGLDSTILVWHEPADWASYDALIFRSPWDYTERTAEFTSWLADTEKLCRIINAPDLARWNLDKRYLLELGARGVNYTPSTFCNTLTECQEAITACIAQGDDYIIKPNISAGSKNTGLFSGKDESAIELCREILSLDKIPIVQPFIRAIQDGAERGMLFFNGRFSHAIRKGPILITGGGYIGGTYTEDITPAAVSDAEIDLGLATLAAIRGYATDMGWNDDAKLPLYARIDVVTPEGGDPMLIEAELFEPSIFIRHSPADLKRFTDAVWEKLA